MERLREKMGKDAWDAGGEMRLRGEMGQGMGAVLEREMKGEMGAVREGEMESVREFAREWEMGRE